MAYFPENPRCFEILRNHRSIGTVNADDAEEAIDKACIQFAEAAGFEAGDDEGLEAVHPSEAF